MNDFKESLKYTPQKQNNNAHTSFHDVICSSIYDAILSVKPKNEIEYIMKAEYLLNINKIMSNYEELRPLLTSYFVDKQKEQHRE